VDERVKRREATRDTPRSGWNVSASSAIAHRKSYLYGMATSI